MAVIHFFDFNVAPPKRYPDLYTVLNVTFSAGIYLLMLLYFNYRQITLPYNLDEKKGKRKAE
jgi:alpha-1,3-glucosyltransferase